MKLLVTGGAGFIGSNFIRWVLAAHADVTVVNLDKLTYAGNPANLADVEDSPRYAFVRGDIAEPADVARAMPGVDAIVNFAAESHVDRSIEDPEAFLRTATFGVYRLLEAARAAAVDRVLQVGTDEVYGSVETGESVETDPLVPRSPYSASKAAGDLLGLSYHTPHGLPVVVTRGSNTYGPYQYPEKVVPLFATNALDDQPLPLYGDGLNVRDWLHVLDHCRGIWTALTRGVAGEVYNIGGSNLVTNIELTTRLLAALGKPESLIQPVRDRPGHDRRYALCSDKLKALGWAPEVPFATGLVETVHWYRDHEAWWRPIKSGEYRAYYERQYAGREVPADG